MFRIMNLLVYLPLLTVVLSVPTVFGQVEAEAIVGIWTLDEGKGDIAGDSSVNGRDGDIQNAKWADGKLGKCLNFTKGNTVVVPLGKGIVRDELTVILWLQFSDLTGQQNYFSIWDSSNNRYVPYKTDGHELRFWSNNWNIGSTFTVKKDTWYHVANVYDGKTASIYVDGDLKISQPGAFTLNDTEQTSWFATDKGGWLSACIEDEIGIFTTALDSDEVKNIMDHGINWALAGAAVEPSDKLSVIWGEMKHNIRYRY